MFSMKKMLDYFKSKSGVSMVFVLFSMTILMLIAGSAVVATSSALGLSINQMNYNQLKSYSDSVNKSLMYALQTSYSDVSKDVSKSETFGGQMLNALYNYADNNEQEAQLPSEVTLELAQYGLPEAKLLIEYEKLPSAADITPSVPASPAQYNELGYLVKVPVDRTPKKAKVEAIVKFTIYIKYEGKEIKTEAKYNFFGATLEDNGVSDSVMIVTSPGEWRMLSVETVDV